jgi:hypothetical protein
MGMSSSTFTSTIFPSQNLGSDVVIRATTKPRHIQSQSADFTRRTINVYLVMAFPVDIHQSAVSITDAFHKIRNSAKDLYSFKLPPTRSHTRPPIQPDAMPVKIHNSRSPKRPKQDEKRVGVSLRSLQLQLWSVFEHLNLLQKWCRLRSESLRLVEYIFSPWELQALTDIFHLVNSPPKWSMVSRSLRMWFSTSTSSSHKSTTFPTSSRKLLTGLHVVHW